MSILEKRIQDPTIIKLIRTGLNAEVFQNDNTHYTPEVGTPQGGILSPLLSNIYLDVFDKYMEKLIEQYEGTIKPGNRKKNPVANKLLRSGQKSKYYSLKISSRIHNQVEYRGCKYIRYADDFLVGILGHRRLAEQVRNKVNEFLKRELNIELSLKKAKITHVSRGIGFLGYVFSRKILFVKQRYGRRVVTRKMTIPTLDVNMNRVIARLSQVGFCAGNGNPIPAFRFLRLPQSETNLKVNQILKGLCE